MNYTDLKQYTINDHPVLTWGCRVLLRDVLALAGYSKFYYFSAKCAHIAHDAPAIIARSGRKGRSRPRVITGARWTTLQDLGSFMESAYSAHSSGLADAIDALTDLLEGKRDPLEPAHEIPTIPAPIDVEAQHVDIPTPTEIVNGRYSKALNAYLGRCASTLTASADTLWLSGSVSVPVPSSVPAHVRSGLAEDAAKALESKGWSVDVHKATADGGQSITLDIAIDTVSP